MHRGHLQEGTTILPTQTQQGGLATEGRAGGEAGGGRSRGNRVSAGSRGCDGGSIGKASIEGGELASGHLIQASSCTHGIGVSSSNDNQRGRTNKCVLCLASLILTPLADRHDRSVLAHWHRHPLRCRQCFTLRALPSRKTKRPLHTQSLPRRLGSLSGPRARIFVHPPDSHLCSRTRLSWGRRQFEYRSTVAGRPRRSSRRSTAVGYCEQRCPAEDIQGSREIIRTADSERGTTRWNLHWSILSAGLRLVGCPSRLTPAVTFSAR